MFSYDDDMLCEAARRIAVGETFAGVVYVHQNKLTVGKTIDDLELLAVVYEPGDMLNRVEYLPIH